MSSKLFCSMSLHRSLFLKTLTHFRYNSSVLAENNVSNSNAPSKNLFAHFVTTRFNISSADTVKMLKREPLLGRLKILDKVEQLADMLNRHGCTQGQIANIIRLQPSLMLTSVERVLEPKIQVLKDLGAERENIPKIVTKSPRILTSKLETLRSNLEFLKTVFPTNDFLVRAIMRNPDILRMSLQKVLKPSVALWEGFGFRGIEFVKFLLYNPWALMRSSLTPGQLDLIRKIDIHKESKMFKYVVSIVANRRSQVSEAKIDTLQLCGLSPEEAWELVRVNPSILSISEENIKKKMDFMFNNMGLSVDFVTKHPRMFLMSLDKVMRPRFLVLQNMTAMNGAGEVKPTRIGTVLAMTEAKFVAQIIERHPESAALWTVYKTAIADVSKSSKIKRFSDFSI
ncbi:hypothetical protein SUGI_0651460 [Cryptomeria japonica]|uniref:uncharacterized protein LOC131035639 n=1 Tax=Cryptomeria japonica TaxID=3369 RepID=UPI002414B577|nr:uncharacterized protein LOC131035639 [Cryptomeria japonica]GLJ32373.1 hypothetical protein SUGI_0651460 [Cryptomeria japonica]